MNRLTLKEAILLAVSGELSAPARERLLAELENNPHLNDEVEKTEEAFRLLQLVPIPEPSAQERREIPAALKRAIRSQLTTREKKATRQKTLTRYAVAASALVLLIVGFADISSTRSSQAAQQLANAQRIDALINRVAHVPAQDTPTVLPPGDPNPAFAINDGPGADYETLLLSTPPTLPTTLEDPSAPPGF